MENKILIDARMYGLENSGIGRYIINLTDELKNIKTEDRYFILLRKKYFDQLNFPENWTKVLADFGHYSVTEQIRLPVIINRLKPDLVHFPHFNIPIFWNGKFVVTIHDLTMHSQGINATTLTLPKYLFKRIPYKNIFKKAVLNSKFIIAPSNSIKDQIVEHFGIAKEKIMVIYEGYREEFSKTLFKQSEIEILSKFKLTTKDYFFYVGNAYPHKNLEIAIRAVKDINENKDIKVNFLIAGSRDVFMQRLWNTVEKYQAQDYVEILGFVKDDELKVLYKHSLGFIYPSLSEGFGLQGLEAIASGTIILCSNIPVFREIYQSHAFYFDPLNLASVSSTVYSVAKLSNIDKNKYLNKAQEFIKRYSWEDMAQKTLEIYHGALY